MYPTPRSALLLIPAVALLFSGSTVARSADTLRGCSARPDAVPGEMDDWGLTVDGELVATYEAGKSEEIEAYRAQMPAPSEIKSAQVICWAAVERMYGARLARGVYSIWTHNVFAGAGDFLRDAHAHLLRGGALADLTPPHQELVATRRDLEGGEHFVIELTHAKWQWMCRVASMEIPADPNAHDISHRRVADAGTPGCFSLHDHLGTGH